MLSYSVQLRKDEVEDLGWQVCERAHPLSGSCRAVQPPTLWNFCTVIDKSLSYPIVPCAKIPLSQCLLAQITGGTLTWQRRLVMTHY